MAAYQAPTSRPRSSSISRIIWEPQSPVTALATSFASVAPSGLGNVITTLCRSSPSALGTGSGSQIS